MLSKEPPQPATKLDEDELIEDKIRVKVESIKDTNIRENIKKRKEEIPKKHKTVLELQREKEAEKDKLKRNIVLDNVIDKSTNKKKIEEERKHKTVLEKQREEEAKVKKASPPPMPKTPKVKEIIEKAKESIVVKKPNPKIIQPKPVVVEHRDPSKPSILLLVDVLGWAWDEKARNLKKWLSDEFNICIRYFQTSPVDKFTRNEEFDLYFSFECGSARFVDNRPSEKKITGVTSHTFTSLRGPWKQGLESSGVLHANSKLLQKELQEMFPQKKVHYVPNGVDEEKFAVWKRNLDEPFTAAYVGKNTKRKGYEDYIVPACKQAGVELKSQTCRFNSPNVIKHKDMPDFYNDVDVVLVASDMDGTPNQLLEATSKGRTFIGNAIGNVPEFIDEGINGFMVNRKIKAYVDKLVYLKGNRSICKEMGLAARQTIEDGWTWKIQAENYRMMFREALGL